MKRFGRVLRLRPGMRPRYEQAHREIWPEVANAVRAAGIHNYSIYFYRDWLFAYFEVADEIDFEEVARRALASDACQRWEKQMQELQEPLPESDGGSWWVAMDELWHFAS